MNQIFWAVIAIVATAVVTGIFVMFDEPTIIVIEKENSSSMSEPDTRATLLPVAPVNEEPEVVLSPIRNEPPTAKISGPNKVTVNKLVTFTADESEDKDGSIEKYQWTVDGKPSSVQSFLEHTFENEATHQVTLDVFDNKGETW